MTSAPYKWAQKEKGNQGKVDCGFHSPNYTGAGASPSVHCEAQFIVRGHILRRYLRINGRPRMNATLRRAPSKTRARITHQCMVMPFVRHLVMCLLILCLLASWRQAAFAQDASSVGYLLRKSDSRTVVWKKLLPKVKDLQLKQLELPHEPVSLGEWRERSQDVSTLRRVLTQQKCQSIVLLERNLVGRPVGLTVRATETGALLHDAAVSAGSESWLDQISAAIGLAVAKLKKPPVTVQLDVEAAAFERDDWLRIETLLDLVERRLSTSSQVAVFPRRLRGVVTPGAQAQIAVTLSIDEIAGSLALLGSISRDGKPIGEVQVFEESAAAAIESVAQTVWKSAGVKAGPDQDRKGLGRRYLQLSESAEKGIDHEVAIRSAEAALLLAPESDEMRPRLVDALFIGVMRRVRHGAKARHVSTRAFPWKPQEANRLHERAWFLVRQLAEDKTPQAFDPVTDPEQFMAFVRRFSSMTSCLRNPRLSITPERRRVFQEDLAAYFSRPLETMQQAAIKDPRLADAYTRLIFTRMSALRRPDFPDAPKMLWKITRDWLDAFDSWPKSKNWWRCNVLRESTYFPKKGRREAVLPLIVRLEKHSVPLLRLYGMRGRLLTERPQTDEEYERFVKILPPLRNAALAVIAEALKNDELELADHTLSFLRTTYSVISQSGKAVTYPEVFDTSEKLLDMGVAPAQILADACNAQRMKGDDHARRGYALMTRLEKLRLSGKAVVGAAYDLARIRNQIVQMERKWSFLRQEPRKSRYTLQSRMSVSEIGDKNSLTPGAFLRKDRFIAAILHNSLTRSDDNVQLQFASVPLDGSSPKLSRKLDLGASGGSYTASVNLATSQFAQTSDFGYVCGQNQSLFRLNLQDLTLEKLPVSATNPDRILAMGCFEDRVYLATTNALHRVSKDNKALETVLSGSTGARVAELENKGTFRINYMVADPWRNQMLVVVLFQKPIRYELWSFSPKTDEWKRLNVYDRRSLPYSMIVSRDRLLVNFARELCWRKMPAPETETGSADSATWPVRLANRHRLWLTGKTIRGLGSGGVMGEYPVPATKTTRWDEIPGAHHELFDVEQGQATRSWASPLNDNSFLFSNGRQIWTVKPTAAEAPVP